VSPTLEYSPAKAKALLDRFGYVDRDGDGYPQAPDGHALLLPARLGPTLRERQRNELWKKVDGRDRAARVTFDKVREAP